MTKILKPYGDGDQINREDGWMDDQSAFQETPGPLASSRWTGRTMVEDCTEPKHFQLFYDRR